MRPDCRACAVEPLCMEPCAEIHVANVIGTRDRLWKCGCGFQTHNEDVWIEHCQYCKREYTVEVL